MGEVIFTWPVIRQFSNWHDMKLEIDSICKQVAKAAFCSRDILRAKGSHRFDCVHRFFSLFRDRWTPPPIKILLFFISIKKSDQN